MENELITRFAAILALGGPAFPCEADASSHLFFPSPSCHYPYTENVVSRRQNGTRIPTTREETAYDLFVDEAI